MVRVRHEAQRNTIVVIKPELAALHYYCCILKHRGLEQRSARRAHIVEKLLKKLNFCINSVRFRVVGEGNNLKPKAIRILESYIKSIFTLVQIQYAEQPEGRRFESFIRY